MSYAIGLKALRRLCETQSTTKWHRAKLNTGFFKAAEVPVFEWVGDHVKKHHALPQLETLVAKFPEVGDVQAPEPASYYVEKLEELHYYDTINKANTDSSLILKADMTNWKAAVEIHRNAIKAISEQQYRASIMDFGMEGKAVVMKAYKEAAMGMVEGASGFGWPYLDSQGGAMPGDVVSFVGRPQAGKSWLSLYTAIHNWAIRKHNVLFVSMEMGHLPIAQRLASMWAGTNLTQLKQGAYASGTYKKFMQAMNPLEIQAAEGGAKLFIVNGNLAADMEDIYTLADQLECDDVIIDGAYLCRHKNVRLDRFTRAAENCELSKKFSEDLSIPSFLSWQFNREASKKQKGQKGGAAAGESVGLEDIGYSDAIGQISSIVLGLFQDDGVESMMEKLIRVLKGRGGEVGQFSIKWNFNSMDFDQVGTTKLVEAEEDEEEEVIGTFL